MPEHNEFITKAIRKYGTKVRAYVSKKEPGLYTVICPGCGKEIRVPGSELDDIQCVITKRDSATFFHTDCFMKVWDSKIR